MINNIETFNADLDAFSKKLNVNMLTVLKKVTLDIFTNIVVRTPVDTGLARASWVIGVNQIPSPAALPVPPKVGHAGKKKGVRRTPPKMSAADATSESMSRMSGAIIDNPFSKITIANFLPYISTLENGSSKQAPSGMVRLAVETEFAALNSVK